MAKKNKLRQLEAVRTDFFKTKGFKYFKNFINTSSRKDIFEALGSNMSWDDFILYEKLNFGGYL